MVAKNEHVPKWNLHISFRTWPSRSPPKTIITLRNFTAQWLWIQPGPGFDLTGLHRRDTGNKIKKSLACQTSLEELQVHWFVFCSQQRKKCVRVSSLVFSVKSIFPRFRTAPKFNFPSCVSFPLLRPFEKWLYLRGNWRYFGLSTHCSQGSKSQFGIYLP